MILKLNHVLVETNTIRWQVGIATDKTWGASSELMSDNHIKITNYVPKLIIYIYICV